MVLTLSNKAMFPDLFDASIYAFKSKINDLMIRILMPLINTLHKESQELNKMRFEIIDNPEMVLNIDLDEIYDLLEKNEEQLKYMLKIVETKKNDDPIFATFYDSLNDALTNVLTTSISYASAEAEMMHKGKLKHAS